MQVKKHSMNRFSQFSINYNRNRQGLYDEIINFVKNKETNQHIRISKLSSAAFCSLKDVLYPLHIIFKLKFIHESRK